MLKSHHIIIKYTILNWSWSTRANLITYDLTKKSWKTRGLQTINFKYICLTYEVCNLYAQRTDNWETSLRKPKYRRTFAAKLNIILRFDDRFSTEDDSRRGKCSNFFICLGRFDLNLDQNLPCYCGYNLIFIVNDLKSLEIDWVA